MKIENVTNDNLVIKARNEIDYKKALRVANKMTEQNTYMVIACEDPYEFWVQITATWRGRQASDMKEAYKQAKVD